MVHSRSITTFAGTAFCLVGLALAGGAAPPSGAGKGTQSKDSGLTLKVLTGYAQNACSLGQIDALKKRKDEAVELAQAGSKALNTRGVEFSDALSSFLGDANPKEMEAKHYAPVASLRSVAIESVFDDAEHEPGKKATAPAGETLFACFGKGERVCTNPDGSATGLAAMAYADEQTIKFCPAFFEKVITRHSTTEPETHWEPISLADAKAPYLAGKDMEGKVLPGRTLFHEFQHMHSVVGSARVSDLYIKLDDPRTVVPRPLSPVPDVVGAYYLSECMGLPSHQKRLNAQNLAFFGLDVWADPDRARPKGYGSGSSKKTSKRFEAIYQRGAENAAAAKSGAKDTPKPAAGGATGTEKAEEKTVSQYKRPKYGFTCRPTVLEG